MVPERADEVTIDRLLGGRVTLRQPARGHRAGTDAVLLAGLCGARTGDRVLDLGSASGAVGLMIAARAGGPVELTLADRDPTLVALARENLAANGLAETGRAVVLDVFAEVAVGAEPLGPPFDLVVTNPPFFGRNERASPDPGRRAAHVMEVGTLDGWIAAAARHLRPRGRLALIHRAAELCACLAALRSKFGGLFVTPVYPRVGEPATRVVITARVGAGGPDVLAPPLVLHGPDSRFTAEAEALHRG